MSEKTKDEAEWIVTPSPVNANHLVTFRRDGALITADQFRRIIVRVAPDFTAYGSELTARSKVILTPVGSTVCGATKAEEIARRLNAPAETWTIEARGGELLASYGDNTPLSWVTAAHVRNAIMYASDTDEWAVEPHTDHDAATCGTPQAKCRSTVRVSSRIAELGHNDTAWLGEALVNVCVEAPRSISPCTLPRHEGPWKVVVHERRHMLSVTRTGGMSRNDVAWLTSLTAQDYTAYVHHAEDDSRERIGHVSLLPLVNPTGVAAYRAAGLEAKLNKAEKTRLRAVPDQANTPEQDAEDEDAARRLFDRDGLGRRLDEAGQQIADLKARLDAFEADRRTADPHRKPEEVASRAFDAVLDALLDASMYEAMGVVREVRKRFSL